MLDHIIHQRGRFHSVGSDCKVLVHRATRGWCPEDRWPAFHWRIGTTGELHERLQNLVLRLRLSVEVIGSSRARWKGV
jgi:hypothetical protein